MPRFKIFLVKDKNADDTKGARPIIKLDNHNPDPTEWWEILGVPIWSCGQMGVPKNWSDTSKHASLPLQLKPPPPFKGQNAVPQPDFPEPYFTISNEDDLTGSQYLKNKSFVNARAVIAYDIRDVECVLDVVVHDNSMIKILDALMQPTAVSITVLEELSRSIMARKAKLSDSRIANTYVEGIVARVMKNKTSKDKATRISTLLKDEQKEKLLGEFLKQQSKFPTLYLFLHS